MDEPAAGWTGPTYYGRSQLKPSPFNNWVVGGYVFLAGLSGGAALISAVADAVRPVGAAGAVRRGRYLAMLAPLLGAPLLVEDLRTPRRFYNMLRVAKGTSPMSIGTWILMGFSAFAGLGAAAQLAVDRLGRRWPRRIARATQVPAAVAGAGLATYTAALFAATSTPLWAAAPEALGVRFGSSSIAAASAALSLAERSARTRRALDAITVAALATELAASTASHRAYQRTGVAGALDGPWGQVEKIGATGLGAMLPIGLHLASAVLGRRAGRLSEAASLATLAGSALLRVAIMGAGDESARRPEISFRFSQKENLPKP
jgi:formate-dependent nitrite reductase membrane component NrfD